MPRWAAPVLLLPPPLSNPDQGPLWYQGRYWTQDAEGIWWAQVWLRLDHLVWRVCQVRNPNLSYDSRRCWLRHGKPVCWKLVNRPRWFSRWISLDEYHRAYSPETSEASSDTDQAA